MTQNEVSYSTVLHIHVLVKQICNFERKRPKWWNPNLARHHIEKRLQLS